MQYRGDWNTVIENNSIPPLRVKGRRYVERFLFSLQLRQIKRESRANLARQPGCLARFSVIPVLAVLE